MRVELDQIKLANAVKLGRNEDLVYQSKQDFRGHGTQIELVALKVPIANAPGEFVTQTVVKLTDKMSKESTYTNLMNCIYFKMPEKVVELPKGKRKATI